jgi:hypothetical protein
MTITIMSPQTMRECRWSQPQFDARLTRDEDPANAPWECVRISGQEHPVSDDDCLGCPHWELDLIFR